MIARAMSTIAERPPVVLYPVVAIHDAICQIPLLDSLHSVQPEVAW
jgi:hypothetical protein